MPFNYDEYQKKCNTLTTEELHKEWENYTRQIAGGATSTATSVLFSPVTGGVSLIGLGLSAPRIHNARKKRAIIEAGLRERGTTHNTRKRDVVAPMAIAGTISGLTLGLAGPGADLLGAAAAEHGAEYVASHAILEGTGALAEHKHDKHHHLKAHENLKLQQQNQSQIQILQPQLGIYEAQTPAPGVQILHPVPAPAPQIQQLSIPNFHHPQGQAENHEQKVTYETSNQIQQLPVGITSNISSTGSTSATIDQSVIPSIVPVMPNNTGTYPPEKTAAWTTHTHISTEEPEFEYPAGVPTPLPSYTQVDQTTQSVSEGTEAQELPADEVNSETVTVTLTMEEEIMFLKAKLLQMEIEKRGDTVPPIASPSEVSVEVTAEALQPQRQYFPPPPPAPAPTLVSPITSPYQHAVGGQAPSIANYNFHPPLPPRSPQPPSSPSLPQQSYPPPPASPSAQKQPYYPPPPPSPQPQLQPMYPQPPKFPQPQVQRNDSGYASLASTPLPQYNPQQVYQHYNPQNYATSAQPTGQAMLSPQPTGFPQPTGHGRTASYSSTSQLSPASPAPPPYFPPPPGQNFSNAGGKDYFGQVAPTGTQGWQWGASVPSQGQPNYGPPPAIPRPYR